VRDHGYRLVLEDCDLRSWARQWGRGIAEFTPGTLVAALETEAAAVARIAGVVGGIERASTRTTALSQHCLCGERVAKALSSRTHACASCGLRGDRDAVSATLGACVVLRERGNAASAEVDVVLARALLGAPHTRERLFATLPYSVRGRQDVLSESTVHSACDGWFVAGKGPSPDAVVVARRIVGAASYPTLHEPGASWRLTTAERARRRADLSRRGVDNSTPLRDSS